MRMGLVNRKSIAPLLIVISLSAPGCKSGWKMPTPSSMWPWSRGPSSETLAGTPAKPTLESPSAKHTPTAINSVAANPKSATGGLAATQGNVVYPNASLASTPARPTYGGMAGGNGYQIGPYGMSGQTQTAVAAPQTTPPQTTPLPGSSTPQGQSAYAGSAGLSTGSSSMTTNPYASPSPGIGSTPGGTAPQSGYSMPNMATATPGTMPNYQPAVPTQSAGGQAPTYSSVGFPTNTPVPPMGSAGPSLPPSSYPVPPSAPAVSSTAGYGGATGYNAPPVNSTATASLPPLSMPAITPTPSAPGTDTYRPGSTNRTTTYSFSSGSTTVPVNSGSTGTPQTSIQMPSNTGYGSFHVPANTAALPAPTVTR